MHTLYLGSSWALQSFESIYGFDDPVKTNLAQELELTNYTSFAESSETNQDQLQKAQNFMRQYPDLAPFRILFVTASSLDDAHEIFGTTEIGFAKLFLTSNDPMNMIKSLEQHFYQQLLALDVPVALIGGATDITFNSHDNITVIHPSWQNFLAQHCGLNSFYGWPANTGRRWLQKTIIHKHGPLVNFDLETPPSSITINEIHKIKIYWRILQKHKLLIGGHPTILGNQLFAREIKQSVNNWIDNHQ